MPEIEFQHVGKVYPDGTHAVTDLNLSVADGEFLCVLGPSGCGKSSTLRMLAGLEPVSSGHLLLDGRRINDVPPQLRDMAMVFENYALYPHLRVFDNIAMPLFARRRPRREIKSRVEAVAKTLQIGQHLHKRPNALSGGERQRVALGRAIVRRPSVFLMDEPLGHLEAYLRVQLRTELRRLHERLGATTVYITHDQEEAAAVSDRIAVMQNGRLQQVGTVLELMDMPVNRFVAEFIGDLPINLLPAVPSHEPSGLRVGTMLLALSPGQLEQIKLLASDAQVLLGVRPEGVSLAGSEAGLEGRVSVLEPQGDRTVAIAETPAGRVSVLVAAHEAPPVGSEVKLRFDMRRAHIFTKDGANLLYPVSAVAG